MVKKVNVNILVPEFKFFRLCLRTVSKQIQALKSLHLLFCLHHIVLRDKILFHIRFSYFFHILCLFRIFMGTNEPSRGWLVSSEIRFARGAFVLKYSGSV